MTDDFDDTLVPDLDELAGDSPAEQAELEHWLGKLAAAGGRSEDPFLRLAFPETGLPAPARSLSARGACEGESPLLERVRAAGEAVLGQLAASAERVRPKVSGLLALPAAERWRPANEEAVFHEVPIVEELLRRAEDRCLPLEEVEALALLVLQVAPRVRFGAFPSRWVGDFLTLGWLLLAEVGLARRDLPRASFALECARAHLQTGSGDSVIVFEVGLDVAFFDWASGRGLGAAAAFKLTLKLAASLRDPVREGEVCLWLDLLFTQLHSEERAFAARTRALSLLGPAAFEQALTSHAETIQRLGLRLPSPGPGPAKEPVS